MSKGLVLVTGASGYIAGFVIKALVDDGWSVRGTVRSLAKADAVRASLGLTAEQLPLFPADLTSDTGWEEAVAGCDYVQHIASPLHPDGKPSAEALLAPARDGALRALKAARDAGVKRLVMTSSVAAICYGKPDSHVSTEADWTDPDSPDAYPYVRSKTVAERSARDWIDAEGGTLEFCTVNPGMVLGPVLGSDYSASVSVITKLLDGSLPGCPRIGFGIVDVRDVASAHLLAMTTPGLHRERFLVAGDFLWMAGIARILKISLGEQARRVPTRTLPDWLVRIVALFDPLVRQVTSELGHRRRCDPAHAKVRLGWTMRPAEQTIVDTARSLIEHGLVKA